MDAIQIARRLAALGQKEDAIGAYALAIRSDIEPKEELEAAAYILQNGGDYRVSYTSFQSLYNRGFFREDILPLMVKVFYEPNVKLLRTRYERNCKRLEKYPYLFRKDFPPFDKLPIAFFPYDDHNGYVPFDRTEGCFGEFVNVRNTVVSRNFFRDLENPILAEDVFSQYELEYLKDNVRKSEYVGRENHVYLHYKDWETFCSWLQVLNMNPLLEEQKLVFLIGDEMEQYPIDFKERFGIDYSQYPVKPVGIREVHRMIWHTQLSTHNGGDFFNEIFDAHPNLLAMPSIMFSNYEENIRKIKEAVELAGSLQEAMAVMKGWGTPQLIEELYHMRDRTDKDLLVALYLTEKNWNKYVDPASRIVPAVFFQPHFSNIVYQFRMNAAGDTILEAENVDQIQGAQMIKGFKYIKTFTPMRRFTTSHGATVKFMYNHATEDEDEKDGKIGVVPDAIAQRVFNRSFMIDPDDRLYRDSVLVRFEDGKLNPKATFTALAAFLDLPYTDSLTYCSEQGVRDIDHEGNVVGFDPATVYRTYDDYVNDKERYFIEYFLRDAYAFYGYGFQYYDGAPVDEEKAAELIEGFTTIDHYMRETWRKIFQTAKVEKNGERLPPEEEAKIQEQLLENYIRQYHAHRLEYAKILLGGLRFVNRKGQPLHMMPKLVLDPALLEQPLYH